MSNRRRGNAGGEKRWLIVAGFGVSPETRAQIARGAAPQIEYLSLQSEVFAELIGQSDHFARNLGRHRRKAVNLASAIQAFRRRRDFDVIYTTGEDVSFWLAPLLRRAGWRGRLITVVHNCGSDTARKLMRFMPKGRQDVFVCFCGEQQRILVEELGVPAENAVCVTNPNDYEFFRPTANAESPCVFAAGAERRDYRTLVEAAAGLDIAFRISASGPLAEAIGPNQAPANVSILPRRVSYAEIKALYDSARLIVVPLFPSTYAAGVNGILEGMAMGKPLVVSDSVGIAEYVKDGETGRVVPAGDPAALRAAIEDLWSDPERCAEIGRRNRDWIVRHAPISSYCSRLRALAGDPASGHANAPAAAPRDPALAPAYSDLTALQETGLAGGLPS